MIPGVNHQDGRTGIFGIGSCRYLWDLIQLVPHKVLVDQCWLKPPFKIGGWSSRFWFVDVCWVWWSFVVYPCLSHFGWFAPMILVVYTQHFGLFHPALFSLRMDYHNKALAWFCTRHAFSSGLVILKPRLMILILQKKIRNIKITMSVGRINDINITKKYKISK